MDSYVVRWTEKPGSRYASCFLRGISSEGRYYGEIELNDPIPGCRHSVEGCLSNDDFMRLDRLAQCIANASGPADLPECSGYYPRGLIAKGFLSTPTILFESSDELLSDSATAKAFAAIVEILRPYVGFSGPGHENRAS